MPPAKKPTSKANTTPRKTTAKPAAKKPAARKPSAKKATTKASTKASTSKSRKPPSTPKGTNTSRKNRDGAMTGFERGIRDVQILEAVNFGQQSYEQIGKTFGISKAQVANIVKTYSNAELKVAGFEPMKFIEAMLNRARVRWSGLAAVALDDEQPGSVRVQAIRGMGEVEGQLFDYYRSLGLLPNNLGNLQWLDDISQLAARMVNAIDQAERGEITYQEVRAMFAEHIGLGQQLELGPGEPVPS